MKNKKIYFASPFFNEEQVEREERLKAKLRELGFDVWSPKEEFFCKPDEDAETRKKVFEGNCSNIESSDIIFAVTDGKDIGTIWEAGFAYGLNKFYKFCQAKPIKIVYYCETLPVGGKFNLMLAQSGDIIITDFADLDKLPDLIQTGGKMEYAGNIE